MIANFVSILRCPVSKCGLRWMTEEEISLLNEQISGQSAYHLEGTLVKNHLMEGLISETDSFVYRVDDGIAILIASLAIVRESGTISSESAGALRNEKQQVRDYYNEFGWHKKGEKFVDQLIYDDMRPFTEEYKRKSFERIHSHLQPSGKFLLDAGSGPLHLEEYLDTQKSFEVRICVDFSYVALQEARAKLADKGLYLLADVTNLPLRDNVADAAVSLHVFYHIPADEQVTAFREVFRTLKAGCSAVVVYTWGGHCMLMKLCCLPIGLYFRLKRFLRSRGLVKPNPNTPKRPAEQRLYFHPHRYRYFKNHLADIPFELACWRSFDRDFGRYYIYPHFLGRHVLRFIFFLETTFPYLFGRIGQYPMFILKKQADHRTHISG